MAPQNEQEFQENLEKSSGQNTGATTDTPATEAPVTDAPATDDGEGAEDGGK